MSSLVFLKLLLLHYLLSRSLNLSLTSFTNAFKIINYRTKLYEHFNKDDEAFLLGNQSASNVISHPYQSSRWNKNDIILSSRKQSLSLLSSKNSYIGEHQANTSILFEPQNANSSSLYIELVVVHDHSQYLEYKGDEETIEANTFQIVNIMNALYRELNIYIALVGIVIWDKEDEIKLSDDGDATLTAFLKYRHEKLLPIIKHDNAQLLTKIAFNGSVVGKAHKGPICTHDSSGGVNTNHSDVGPVVAVTLAHEIGHNLGMEHDEKNCTCPDEKCIMSPSSNQVHPKHWSSCSIDSLNESKRKGSLKCLERIPERDIGPVCGNGFIEEGEDCDPGIPIPEYETRSRRLKCRDGKNCRKLLQLNPCCNSETCKFATNASCAIGPCCDLKSCKPFNSTQTKMCRDKKSECDLEEYCDGKSEHCPDDVYFHNGIPCGPLPADVEYELNSLEYNRSKAFCFQGRCGSHQSQCQLLWGQEATISKNICFEQNIHGNISGHCGYDFVTKTYTKCQVEDSICGMLHCVHNQNNAMNKAGKLHYGLDSTSVLTVSFYTTNPETFCHGALIDSGINVQDFGLVPNGAACGDNKMCVNQKCIEVQDIIETNRCYDHDCNSNGICDNKGICHCLDGSIGQTCPMTLWRKITTTIYYIVIFSIPIGIILFALLDYKPQFDIFGFMRNRKDLRNKAYEMTTASRNQFNSTNNVNSKAINKTDFSDQCKSTDFFNDPWRDQKVQQPMQTSVDIPSCTNLLLIGDKPTGYRLEPLKKIQDHPMRTTQTINVISNNQNETNNLDSSSQFVSAQVPLKPVRPAPRPPR